MGAVPEKPNRWDRQNAGAGASCRQSEHPGSAGRGWTRPSPSSIGRRDPRLPRHSITTQRSPRSAPCSAGETGRQRRGPSLPPGSGRTSAPVLLRFAESAPPFESAVVLRCRGVLTALRKRASSQSPHVCMHSTHTHTGTHVHAGPGAPCGRSSHLRSASRDPQTLLCGSRGSARGESAPNTPHHPLLSRCPRTARAASVLLRLPTPLPDRLFLEEHVEPLLGCSRGPPEATGTFSERLELESQIMLP